MARVCLITSSIEDDSRAAIVNPNSHYPIGIAYLHSYLEQAGNEVETMFLNDYSYEDCDKIVMGKITEFCPAYVGFQIISHNRVSSFKLIENIHERYPAIKIIIGGIHTSMMYQQILERYPYVVAVIGEGEETFRELVQEVSLSEVCGIAYHDGTKVTCNKERTLFSDLDQLPFPKHEVFFVKGRDTASILTSRGCPFSCTFCCLDVISKRKVRFRSITNVVDEIEFLSKIPGIKRVWIHDDSFFLDNDRVIKICNEIIRRNIKLRFTCSGRLKPLSIEMIHALEAAGFDHVLFGLESGAASILKSCQKNITQEDAIEAFRLFAKSPIMITTFLIVGLPGETQATLLETALFIQKLQKIKYSYYDDMGVLAIYPGTEVYEISKRNKIIDDSFWLTDAAVPLYTAEHSREVLFKMKEDLRSFIAFKEILTVQGFFRQFKVLPKAIEWVFRFKLKGYLKRRILKILN